MRDRPTGRPARMTGARPNLSHVPVWGTTDPRAPGDVITARCARCGRTIERRADAFMWTLSERR